MADPVPEQSPFIVYVDESGDHSLEKIDSQYPIFVLAFCVFYKENYIEKVVTSVERLKFSKFGHDIVILHERDIRKETGLFKFRDRSEREAFVEELTEVIEANNFILIACLIDKRRVDPGSDDNANPYHMALGFCLETLFELQQEKGHERRETHIVFEQRGSREDRELELEFRRICDGANTFRQALPFKMVLAAKSVNSAGLQLADLVARPIGLNYLRPEQPNRAFAVLRPKFFCSGGRTRLGEGIEGWGLKVFPIPESEKPR